MKMKYKIDAFDKYILWLTGLLDVYVRVHTYT